MWKLTKKYWKDMWDLMWSKTTLDEITIGGLEEIRKRARLSYRELQDVAKAIKEVGNQLGDIDDAIMGAERRGKKPNKK